MQTFYLSFFIFSILADSRNQLCFVGSQWIHLYRTGIYGYGYIHGYPRKICGYGYGYGWEISYPQQPWRRRGCRRRWMTASCVSTPHTALYVLTKVACRKKFDPNAGNSRVAVNIQRRRQQVGYIPWHFGHLP